jgi:hypothetical protein
MGGEDKTLVSWRGNLPLILALILTAVFSGPVPQLQPRNVLAGLRLAGVTRSRTCPPDTFYLDDACLLRHDYEPLRAVSEYLRTHLSDSQSVAIFPFENMYADVARRRVAGGVLQNYQIAGQRLMRRQLEGLDRDNPVLAVFSADGLATLGVDGVPNFTRTPEVWLYLHSRFIRQAELAPGVVVLGRDQIRLKRWRTEITSIGQPSEAAIRLKQAIPIALDYWPADYDFLKLRMRVDYPIWWRLTKPAAPSITIRHADGSEKTIRIALPPNTTSELWIYPWDESHLLNYFDSDETAWRIGRPRASVSAVFLQFQRLDWLSATPARVGVYAVEAVRLGLDGSR